MGDEVAIDVLFLDRALDLRPLIQEVRSLAGSSGARTMFLDTGPVMNPILRQTFEDAVASGGNYFGGQIAQVGPKQFFVRWSSIP